ncbi:beta-1,4-N-acetylgalactosaminyltransferase bre-4-like [Leptopilina heterotoma]|uniref:beta-1,4-N-acetylgalactosaminyltransferase bre-4-like n=1 Tax=Leptopilina heterotoma TaxID=63436 RepID=UPI001CA90895|nr:beta-1,4-N-acetylgalactosaminyltransferase bre-4-like [Leptopilina heterotoma]XP_043463550.1 beta-1,4-N-acetylgalactosaminyltransferase bre-4-like [Leptopilina heterotoma]XP_043463551.1 beta-1,4-N-acetylgalactosaminyltransferase bre-4-like [Leptopilina heterotoma]
MTLATAVAVRHWAHAYKALACVVLTLIAIQYLLSGIFDRRSIETIFTINATRYSTSYYKGHPRGLIIYKPETTPSISGNSSISPASVVSEFAIRTGNDSSSSSSSSSSAASSSSKVETISLGNSGGTSMGIGNPSISNTSMPNVTETTIQQQCPLIPPNLVGPVLVIKTPPELSIMEKNFTRVKPGGRGFPTNCITRHHVAIIIPFRDRPQHLQTLLYNLHPILLRQQIDYQIFIVEQEGTEAFNRAMLMNVGYKEALKERSFDCFIFHDVDLLPEDDRNLYNCPEQPRHMSVAIDKFKYRLPYADLFGGVSAMTKEHFKLVNGFSNVFSGWGGEDDDMANRIKAHGLRISRYPANIARYKMLNHKKEKANPKRYEFLKTGKKRFATDGLSNLKYELRDKQKPKLYTWLLVRLKTLQPS